MRRLIDIDTLPDDARGASAAIGNFDGVHLGHQAVLDAARSADAPLAVVTFEPHPREVFDPDGAPFRLMNAEARAHRLEALGVQLLFEVPFKRALTQLSPAAFVTDILSQQLGLSRVVTGQDFRFGRDRAGDTTTLAELGRRMGIEVVTADLMAVAGNEVSSTRIRAALSDGDPQAAAAMLGHLHRIEGPVLHGEKRGRDLGYPTANLGLEGLHLPRLGVYAVRVKTPFGDHDGVASLGVRPMFGRNAPNLETYIFDFDEDLYGHHISVGLVAFLRPEETFDSLPALIRQMDDDSAQARRALA